MIDDPCMKLLGVRSDSSPERLLDVNANAMEGKLGSDAVLQALQRRLLVVAEHPEGQAPIADEVRIALHLAARQLLDRIHPRGIQREDLEAARNIIESEGELSDEVLARIGAIADARGIEAGALISAVFEPSPSRSAEPVASRREATREASASASKSAELTPRRVVESPVRWMVYVGSGLIASVAVIAIVLSIVLRPDPSSRVGSASQTDVSRGDQRGPRVEDSAKDSNADTAEVSKSEERVREWADCVRDLADCAEMSRTDPAVAVKGFIHTFDEMAQKWPEALRDELLASGTGIIDFLYSIQSAEQLVEIAGAISASDAAPSSTYPDAGAVRALCFSTALAVRLSRESELPTAFRSTLRESSDVLFAGELSPREQTFDAGLRAALNAVPKVLVSRMALDPSPERVSEAWRAWIEALAKVEGRDSAAFDRILTIAIESVMSDMPEADRDVRTRDVLTMLGSSLTWRKDSSARGALLRWFETKSVSSADLQALTSAIATGSGAEGVDPTMVLSASADSAARAALRSRYAQAWGVADVGRSLSGELARWSRLAQSTIEESIPESHVLGMLKAVHFARLSALAEALREGVAVQVPDRLDDSDSRVIERINKANEDAQLIVIDGGGDRDWALRYLAELKSGSASTRISMLRDFAQSSTALNADVIAQEAFRGSPEEIRQHARRILRDRSSDPVFVNAVLRIQPKVIANGENLQLIEAITGHALPSFKSPSWRYECRRALVSKLVQLLARESPIGVIDSISESLAQAYGAFRGEPTSMTPIDEASEDHSPNATKSEDDPLIAAIELRKRLLGQAERLVPSGREHSSLYAIEAARRRRTEFSAGIIQRFHAEQLTCVDLLAYVVVAEEPSKSAEVRDVIRTFEQSRRASTHVLEQVRFAELARLRLWMLRIGIANPAEQPTDSTP